MSKLSESLRAIGVYNNFELLSRFGDERSVAIEYHRRPEGRLGWCHVNRTILMSPRPVKGLDEPTLGRTFQKEFIGNRSESFYAARNWAAEQFGHDYVPSPFGGLAPKHVLHKAKRASLPPADRQPAEKTGASQS